MVNKQKSHPEMEPKFAFFHRTGDKNRSCQVYIFSLQTEEKSDKKWTTTDRSGPYTEEKSNPKRKQGKSFFVSGQEIC